MKILELQQSPRAFREALQIDTDAGPQPLSEVIDAWQEQDFKALDKSWQLVAGQQVEAEYQRAWLERPRGHSKSCDVMVMAAWLLFASRRQRNGVVVACDKDQAALDRDHVARFLSLNPWLSNILDVQNYKIVNRHTSSSMEILASDVASSYGLLVDFAICDEVTLWPKRDLFDSILSAAAKRSHCLLLCIGNAGFMDSWQFELRSQVKNDPRWYFNALDGPKASWISRDILAEQERLLPTPAYERLWLNLWSSGAGDALSPADIQAAFKPELKPHTKAEPGLLYVCGVDAGISRDASALCVLGVRIEHEHHGHIFLGHTKVWKPSKKRKVNLLDVEQEILRIEERYDLKQINYDPYELRYLATRLQAGGTGGIGPARKRNARPKSALPLVEVPPTGANLQKMASVMMEAFADRRLHLYQDEDLERDIRRMRIEERSYGFRLTSPRDEHGHGDLGNSFALALLAAADVLAAGHGLSMLDVWDLFTWDHTDYQAEFKRRQAEFKQEYERLAAIPEGNGFIDALKENRVRVLGTLDMNTNLWR